ncbi:MarR family winged helix-turn-helix transcriptional regulator [Amorphus coralli]|uniref:MarR family winged helix-turn-helix transcriptional regulator n=1 Tax=Amorphus coralli TaxID=340680 RepID=UPI000364B248|nr:MarR family winged helix-turn-helix transcriptional regulator [Amorphus coralli]
MSDGSAEKTKDETGAPPTFSEIGLEGFAPYLFNRISERWNTTIREALKGSELTTVRMRALATLSARPGLTINELSVLAVCEQSTMSRNLDALEEAGYVRRVPKSDDLRARELYITPEGQRALDAFWPAMHAHHEALLSGLEEREREQLLALLNKVLRTIRQNPY